MVFRTRVMAPNQEYKVSVNAQATALGSCFYNLHTQTAHVLSRSTKSQDVREHAFFQELYEISWIYVDKRILFLRLFLSATRLGASETHQTALNVLRPS